MITTLLRGLCRSIDLIVMLSGKAAAFIMPMLAAVVAFEVFSRYFLGAPTIWAYDLSLFMFGYMAALGGAYAQQQRAHINVDILYLKMSHKTRCVFNLISFSMGIFFLLIIIDVSVGKYTEAIEFDYRRQSEWAPPMFHFWIMVTIACGLFLVQLVRDMLADLYYLFSGTALIDQKGVSTDGN